MEGSLSQGKCNFPQRKLSLSKFQMVIVDKKFTPGKDLRLLRGVQMVIVEKKFTSGKDLRLLHGGPGGVPGGSRGGPGGVTPPSRGGLLMNYGCYTPISGRFRCI